MQYKGLKMMKRVAAVIVSAAIMLADIRGVSAMGTEQAFTAETIETEMTEASAQTGMEDGLSVEDLEAETQTQTVEPVETVPAETVAPVQEEAPVETETKETQSTEAAEGVLTQVTADETQDEEPQTDIDEVEKSEEGLTSEEDDLEDASEIAVDEEVLASGENDIQFRYYSDDNSEMITQMPISISMNESVTIAAVLGVETLPVGAKIQWASSRTDYVKVIERADIAGVNGINAVTLEGVKPTTDLESDTSNGSVSVTCVLTYKENDKLVMRSGILNVRVRPLAQSIAIEMGENVVTGKTAVYDIGINKFIAVDNDRLITPVETLSAAVLPSQANQKVTWTSSNTSVMRFVNKKEGTDSDEITDNGAKTTGKEVEVTGSGAGEAVITATAMDGSKVAGTVRVKALRAIEELSFTPKSVDKDGEVSYKNGIIEMAEGTSLYLEPSYVPTDATVKKVSWSNDNNKALELSVNENTNVLKMTAKSDTANTKVKLKATATDMSEKSWEVTVYIKPRVKKIEIFREDDATKENCLNGKNIGVDPEKDGNVIRLKAFNTPEGALSAVRWSISNDKIAKCEAKDENTCEIKIEPDAKGTAVITATAIDGSKMTAVTTLNVTTLAEEVVIEGSSMVMKGKTIKLTAKAVPQAVANMKFKWESMMPEIASVNASTGEVIGKKQGVAIIRVIAMDGSGATNSHTVQVTDLPEKFDIINNKDNIITGKTLGIDPDRQNLNTDDKGTTASVSTVAIKILPDTACQEVEWKSSNEKIVTVKKDEDGNHAVITAKAIGKATITAKAVDGSGKTASIQVYVNTLSTGVKITGGHYLARDMTLQLKAEITNKDAANKSVIWKSSAPKIAEVDETGLVTATGKDGTAVITAEAADGSGEYKEHSIYVVNGESKVDITAINDGGYPITSDKNNNNKKMDVDLSEKDSVSVAFLATVEGYTQRDNVPYDIKWSTSSKNIATVKADENNPQIGYVTIYRKGTVRITATSAEGSEASKTVTINVKNDNPYVTITGPSHRLARGKKMKLSTGSVPVTWESSNEGVATVSNKGQVTADRYDDGTVIITAKSVEGTLSNTYQIDVGEPVESVELMIKGNPVPLEKNAKIGVDITKGYGGNEAIQLSANLKFADGSDEPDSSHITWKSSNKAVAVIDENGNVELKKNGNVTFTATATDGTNKKAKVTFVVAKQLTNIEAAGDSTVYVGFRKSVQLQLKCTPLAAAKRKIIWESEDPSVVSVGKNNGKITGKMMGESTTIRASAADNSAITCEFTVYVEPPVNSVKIVSAGGNGEYQSVVGIDLGVKEPKPVPLTANLFVKEDGEEVPYYGSGVTWKSSNKNIATVDENGVVTGIKNGEVTITATATDGSKKSGKVKVYCGKLITSITDTAPSYVLSQGITLNLRSKDKKVIDLANKLKVTPVTATNQKFTYTSMNKKVATVNANGRVTAKGAGITWIVVTPKDGSGANDSNLIKTITVTVKDPYESDE